MSETNKEPEKEKNKIELIENPRADLVRSHCEMQQCDGCPNEQECEEDSESSIYADDEPDGTDDGESENEIH
jgi:hypothetical protein